MSVRGRLQRLTGGTTDGGSDAREGSRAADISVLRERIEAILSRRPEAGKGGPGPSLRGRGVALEDLVPGAETANAAGVFFCVNQRAGGAVRHGARCIRDWLPLDMPGLAVLANDAALNGLAVGQALFLDTETTGLAGGAGTVPFLIGLGWFEEGGFATRQLFARDYAEERAALVHLRELAADRRFLVTFNGKAFDVNLLATRFILNRLPDPLSGLPHLDLLHPARRLLSHRLGDRRLGALEAAILGFEREGDIPGSEIPRRYFDWLRSRDGRLMADVFTHNRLDILSLAALAARLSDMIVPDGGTSADRPDDRLAAARLLLARDCPETAARMLAPLCACPHPDTAREAARELSLLHKRAGRWTAAVRIWEEMAGRDPGDAFALVELAKWWEHRRHDFDRALALTERAGAGRLSGEDRAALDRRRDRLNRKRAARSARV
ncbi:MAG TPA: ribonuclease H-like domain-containing protein [Syntrophales bacterium]|nr:ribonuclease H-like domain-containing protein [Syntrophales bacterium]